MTTKNQGQEILTYLIVLSSVMKLYYTELKQCTVHSLCNDLNFFLIYNLPYFLSQHVLPLQNHGNILLNEISFHSLPHKPQEAIN